MIWGGRGRYLITWAKAMPAYSANPGAIMVSSTGRIDHRGKPVYRVLAGTPWMFWMKARQHWIDSEGKK